MSSQTAENSASVAVQAHAEAFRLINSEWALAKNETEQIGAREVRVVNRIRAIGLALQGLCGHEQLKLSFFEAIRERLPEDFDFVRAQKCVQVANKLPEAVETHAQAKAVLQMCFCATGFEQLPERAGVQVSHATTPDLAVWHIISHVKTDLEKTFSEADAWDNAQRQEIRAHLDKLESTIRQLKAKL